MPAPINRNQGQNKKPKTPYELQGLIRSLGSPQNKQLGMGLRQQLLINMLLSYIDNPQIIAECFAVGITGLSDTLLKEIGQGK